MLVYNVTSKIPFEQESAWCSWMQEVHIPEVMATGRFIRYRLLRLLDMDDPEGCTYTVQYSCESRAEYDRYIAENAPILRQRSFAKWGDSVVSFRTLMQVIN